MAAREGSAEDLLQRMIALLYYSDDTYWHDRVLIWKVADTSWYVLMPDYVLHEESFTLTGDDGPAKLKVKGLHFEYFSRLRPKGWLRD